MRFTTKWGVILLMLLTAGCNGPKSGAGLRLPDGDVQRGKTAFLELKCNTCHTVAGTEIPPPSKDYAYVRVVALGGEVRQVKTYGALVTSIINPSHSLPRIRISITSRRTTSFSTRWYRRDYSGCFR